MNILDSLKEYQGKQDKSSEQAFTKAVKDYVLLNKKKISQKTICDDISHI